jgi:hypothetical protein
MVAMHNAWRYTPGEYINASGMVSSDEDDELFNHEVLGEKRY